MGKKSILKNQDEESPTKWNLSPSLLLAHQSVIEAGRAMKKILKRPMQAMKKEAFFWFHRTRTAYY
jgi:hypothetical protein